MIGPKKVECTPIAQTAASISGMLASIRPGAADHHDADLGQLDDADEPRLVVVVGELAGQRREEEEGQDEQALRDGAELGLLRRVRIELVDDEQHHRLLEQVVVERAEQLGREQRQEPPRAQQVGDVLDQALAAAGCHRTELDGIASFAHAPIAITASARTMLTLPNLLTLSRILAVPILVFLLWRPAPFDYAITFVLYCMVGITDYFDGYLARAQGQVSRLGQFLDPIADKIMVAAVIVMLMPPQGDGAADHRTDAHHPGADHPAARDHRLGPARVPRRAAGVGAGQRAGQVEDDLPAGRARRADPRRRAAAMPWVHQVGLVSLWAAAALTLVTGWDYLRVGLKHMD